MQDIINNINWLDLAFIILFLGMIYKGLRTGVGGQIISLIGLFLLIFVSIHYYTFLAEGIFGFMLQKWAKPVTFFCISAIILIIIKVLDRLFNVAGGEGMAFVERIGGLLVACLRAVLLFGVISILLLVMPVDYTRNSVLNQSRSAMFFVNADAEIYCQISKYLGFSEDTDREKVIKSFTAIENETKVTIKYEEK